MALKKKSKNKTKPKSAKKETLDWPNKRNILFRPGRMEYVRKMIKTTGCVFCRSADLEMSVDSLCVYKTLHTQIVLNKYPYNNGHLLVLPLVHVGELVSLSPERYDDLHRTIRVAIQAIEAVYQPTGFNIGLNHGATGGAGIPAHLHYHIVPRWSGDLNFFPLIADTKVVIETVEQSYKKFAAHFAGHKGKV